MGQDHEIQILKIYQKGIKLIHKNLNINEFFTTYTPGE